MPSSWDKSGSIGLRLQVLPEIKIRPYAKGEVTRSQSKGTSADAGPGGYYRKPYPSQAPAPQPTEGVKKGELYYREGGRLGPQKSAGNSASDDDGDDDNAAGGLIRKVKGPKPKGSKDDGKISAQRGEFIIKKAAVKQHGVPALNALNSGRAKIVMAKPSVPKTRRK